jgi:HEAT repeat protein
MKRIVLSTLWMAASWSIVASTAMAHGGQYRGPGEVVPPNPTGGHRDPPGPTSDPGISIEVLTTWDFWWEFNKDAFFRRNGELRAGGRQNPLRPTAAEIETRILPMLKKALDDAPERDFDILSACMIAIAKIGRHHDGFDLLGVFRPRLKGRYQEIRETAALSIGIAGITSEDGIGLLSALALDTPEGRKASDAPEISDRTRAFAVYGLGLAAQATSRVEGKRKVFHTLEQLLADETVRGRNLPVAVLQAMSLLNPVGTTEADRALLADALQVLENYYRKPMPQAEQSIQSHCATSIAKLIGRKHEQADHYKRLFSDELAAQGPSRRIHRDIARACVLALGQLCQPNDDESSVDAKYSRQLLALFEDHEDEQVRNFAVLALGQIGGAANRKAILMAFDKADPRRAKPWCALSLGLGAFHEYEMARTTGSVGEIDKEIGATLFEALKRQKEPGMLSALSIGLGLCRYTDAADTMRALMLDKVAKEDLAGYLCIGLALMDDVRSVPDIQNVVRISARRPDLLRQASLALGRLGGETVADQLLSMIKDGEPNLAKLSAIASALGSLGDRRTVEPLLTMLLDYDITEYSRAFAAVALGGIADEEPLPWNSTLGAHINYRAAVDTLTNRSSGILDIL